jgi:hypothetical protein
LAILGIGNVGATFSSGCRDPLASIIFFAQLLIYSTAFGVFGWLLGGQHDNLRIKTEFRFTTIFCAIASIPWFSANVIPEWQSLVVIQYPIIPLWSGAWRLSPFTSTCGIATKTIAVLTPQHRCVCCVDGASVYWICYDVYLPVLSIVSRLPVFSGRRERGTMVYRFSFLVSFQLEHWK